MAANGTQPFPPDAIGSTHPRGHAAPARASHAALPPADDVVPGDRFRPPAYLRERATTAGAA